MGDRARPRAVALRYEEAGKGRAPTDCWPWPGSINHAGYGVAGSEGAHRWAWRHANQLPIPDKMTVDHRCHPTNGACPGGPGCAHRRCVNPRHLELSTPADNRRRSVTYARPTCAHGHPRTGEFGYRRNGEWRCRACTARSVARYKEKRTQSIAEGWQPSTTQAVCRKGHPRTPENLVLRGVALLCRTCERQRWQKCNQNRKRATGLSNGEKASCPRGHPYDEANTYHPPSRPTTRYCRACWTVKNAARAEARKRRVSP